VYLQYGGVFYAQFTNATTPTPILSREKMAAAGEKVVSFLLFYCECLPMT